MPKNVINKQTAADMALMSKGSYGDSGDVQDHVLYDSQLFQATTVRATSTFFSTPIGGTYGSGVKAIQETNLQDPGKLPAGQSFLIKSMSIHLVDWVLAAGTNANTIAEAFMGILKASTFEIRLAGREFDFQVPGKLFTPNVAIFDIASAANSNRIGDYITSGWVKLNTPITIGELVSFNVTQRTASAVSANNTQLNTWSNSLNSQNAAMMVMLKGTLTRAK